MSVQGFVEQQIFKVISGQIDLDAMFSEGIKMKSKQVLNLFHDHPGASA